MSPRVFIHASCLLQETLFSLDYLKEKSERILKIVVKAPVDADFL